MGPGEVGRVGGGAGEKGRSIQGGRKGLRGWVGPGRKRVGPDEVGRAWQTG